MTNIFLLPASSTLSNRLPAIAISPKGLLSHVPLLLPASTYTPAWLFPKHLFPRSN